VVVYIGFFMYTWRYNGVMIVCVHIIGAVYSVQCEKNEYTQCRMYQIPIHGKDMCNTCLAVLHMRG